MPSAAPSRRLPRALAGVGVVLALVAGLGPGLDGPGRTICAVVAGALFLAALVVARLGPTVAAGPDALVVRDGLRVRRLPWPEITAIRSDSGRRSRALEIDLGEDLVVVPAYLLGDADLARLADELEACRQAAG